MLSNRMKASSLRRLLHSLLAFALVVGLVPVLPTRTQAAEQDGATAEARSYAGFSDVQPTDWYVTSGDLDYAISHGLLSGYSDGRFGPNDAVTRGQVVTVLWRMADEPTAEAGHFADVDYSQYYATPISWARLTGVASGYGDTNTFRPDDPISREELCVMLANYANRLCYKEVDSDGAALDRIAGSDQVSEWAKESVGWAVGQGIISGALVNGTAWVDPQANALRCAFAKMATVLHRDFLDGVGCLAWNGGIWHYEDQYIMMDLPFGWINFNNPSPMGNTSGVFHVDFRYRGARSPMTLRVDGAKGWNAWVEVSPLSGEIAQVAWNYSRGNASGWDLDDIELMLDFVTAEKLDASDIGACASAEDAIALAQYYSGQIRFRAFVK